MKCELCLDDPPNEAVIEIATLRACLPCAAEMIPSLTEKALEEMTVIYPELFLYE